MEIIIVIGVIFLICTAIDKITRTIFQVKRQRIFSLYEPVNSIQRIGERILFGIFLAGLILVNTSSTAMSFQVLLVSYIIVLNIFRSFMEWKFERESREYLVSLVFLVMMLPTFFIVEFLYERI